jgi:hypothetical protein
MLKYTPTGMDFRKTLRADLRGGTRKPMLPDLSTTNTTSGCCCRVVEDGKLNLGTRVTMRADEFGMVGCVSRRAHGEEREAHLMRRMKSVERDVLGRERVVRACCGLKGVLMSWVRPPRWTEIGWEGDCEYDMY